MKFLVEYDVEWKDERTNGEHSEWLRSLADVVERDGKLFREVDVPEDIMTDVGDDKEALAEQIFFFGQNDFQNRQAISVSEGDIIWLSETDGFKIGMLGFSSVKKGDF